MVHEEQPVRAGGSVRQRLLDAAEELFYSRGIAGVGVDAVVARAGVATASLYKHFGGKDGLVAAYLRARDERWREHWETHIHRHTDPQERVLAVFEALEAWDVDQVSGRGCAHLAALQQLAAGHPGAAASRDHKEHMLRRFDELVTAARCAGPEMATDLMLVYEGALALQGAGLVPDAVDRGRQLARRHLESRRPAV